jgi:flagellar hook-associated protein 3 FlgL
MGAFRVTQRLLVDRVLTNLGSQNRAILRLQEQLSTGQRVNRPSDAPLDARRAISARAEINKYEQYLTNISTAGPQLTETETTVQTVIDRVQRARELALQGASGTNAQTQRDQIAIEVNQLLEGILVDGNHQTNGRYIFGGTRTLAPPFEATRDANGEITAVTYVGNDTRFELEIQDGVRVPVNQSGSDVFGTTGLPGVDAFQMLIDLRDNLRANDQTGMQARLTELDLADDQLGLALAGVGSVQNRMNGVEAELRTQITQQQQVLSDAIDADIAEVIINLNAQNNAFQAALSAGANVIQPSLLDFIR